jgi:hypothetical protein
MPVAFDGRCRFFPVLRGTFVILPTDLQSKFAALGQARYSTSKLFNETWILIDEQWATQC